MTDIKTKIAHTPCTDKNPYNAINPPIVRASTLALDCIKGTLHATPGAISYGRHGTEPHASFKSAISHLEDAYDTIITNSGLEAVSKSILSHVKTGDNILMTDGVYEPTRIFCDKFLSDIGITTTYYDPEDMNDLQDKVQDNTTVIFAEFPASATMRMGDIEGILDIAKIHNLISIVDNCWGAGVLFQPLKLGFDISIQSATKYISGHADVMLGTIACREESCYKKTLAKTTQLGLSVSPDAVYLGLRGLRTIHTRIAQHAKNADVVINWLQQNPLIKEVLAIHLPEHHGHDIWKKHYNGFQGLFSFTFVDNIPTDNICHFINDLELFITGFGWGGFESVVSLVITPPRTVKQWEGNPIVRMHVGLEDPQDLIADLQQSMEKHVSV